MRSLLSLTICLGLALSACTNLHRPEDTSNSFIVNMMLDGLIPYGDSYTHVLNSLGRPDSSAAIYTDKADSAKNTRHIYFKNSSFIKYGDSVKLDRIDLAALPGTFVTCNKIKLTDKSTVDELKAFHPQQMESELTTAEQNKYTLWGIPDKPGSYAYWMFYFDKKTKRLIRMAHLSFS